MKIERPYSPDFKKSEEYTVLSPESIVSEAEVAKETQVVIDQKSGKIVKIGDPRDVRDWLAAEEKEAGRGVGETIEGGDVIAGLTDAHQHPIMYAVHKLMGAQYVHGFKKSEVLKKVQESAKLIDDPSKPLFFIGLDTSQVKDLTENDLSQMAPGRDIVVFDASMHGGVVSSEMGKKIQALADSAKEPLAGYLKPDGNFSEEYGLKALAIAESAYSIENMEQSIDMQLEKYLCQGITSMHDLLPGTTNGFIAALLARKKWKEKNMAFPITRFHLREDQIQEIGRQLPELERAGLLDQEEFSELVGLKLFADGSFGTHTAKMGEPYNDYAQGGSGGRGIFFDTIEKMNGAMKIAQRHGIKSVATHAIGDEGIQRAIEVARQWIDIGEKNKFEPNFRIEHFELPLPTGQILKSVKELGAWVVPQPNFLLDYVYKDRLGDRTRWICPHQEIMKTGIPMMFGTDGMPDSMLYAIYLATHAGEQHQRLSLLQALMASTITAAHFEGDARGEIKEGHRADIIVADPSLIHALSSNGIQDFGYNQERIAEMERTIRKVYKNGVEVASRI